MRLSDLDARLLDAHAADDRPALISLYLKASNAAQSEDAQGFYLTHAYIFALDAGEPIADQLHEKLVQMGRDV